LFAKYGVYSDMFEQSMVLPTPDKKRWTFALSLTLQVAFLSVLMLIPLIYTDQLSAVMMRGSLFAPPLPPPAPPPPVQRVAQTQQRTARPTNSFVDFLKNLTPKAIDRMRPEVIVDAPALACSNCVAGSTNHDPNPGFIGDRFGTVPPPPPPPPAPERKPEVVKETQRIRVGGSVQNAMMVRRVMPAYPALAKQARVSGTVRLQGVISKEGTIQQLQVISGHPLLVPAALEAVKQWVYRPTLLNGDPVEVIAPIDVNFTLSGN
jgi:periplasmic protein TonB